MDIKIKIALQYANLHTNHTKNYLSNKYGIKEYWKNKNEFEWDDLCDFANKTFSNVHTTKFALYMLIYFLQEGHYQGKHKDKLLNDLPDLIKCAQSFHPNHRLIFQHDYEELYFIESQHKKRIKGITVFRLFNCDNFFGSIYIDYLKNKCDSIESDNRGLNYDFMRSVENFIINSLNDIDSNVFWHQINFFKKFYTADENMKYRALRNVCRFYRWLLSTYNNHKFFVNSTNLTYELIFSNALFKHIINDVYFTTFTCTENLSDKPKILFILNNFQNTSTRLTKISHLIVNTSTLETGFYRVIINKYIQNVLNSQSLLLNGEIKHIVDCLHMLEQVKKQKNYPDTELTSFSSYEATMIRKLFKNSNPNQSLSTLNNKIGSARRFLQWAKKCNYLTFDTTFFDYLSQYEEPNILKGNAISDIDLKKLNDQFILLCQEDTTYRPYYAIFLILIETEFRISQVCNLTVSSLQPTLKKDQFFLYSNTKTSHGRKLSQPICSSTKKILEAVINDTEELRNKALTQSFKDHIFIYQSYLGYTVKGIYPKKFRDIFHKVCKEAGTKSYNSKNLRDTHMTKAFEFVMRNGKSDLEMGLLSKHTRIDTTKSHYIEMQLTKMLESTYQVTLGNRDINQKNHILDELPKEFEGNDTLIENNCGHCIAKKCNMTGSLPCLVCEHFVTTIEHKPYFTKMISNCDELLKRTTIRHEIEDINLIKTLYINWYREICIKEEENDAITIRN